jgi:hypothetical protein
MRPCENGFHVDAIFSLNQQARYDRRRDKQLGYGSIVVATVGVISNSWCAREELLVPTAGSDPLSRRFRTDQSLSGERRRNLKSPATGLPVGPTGIRASLPPEAAPLGLSGWSLPSALPSVVPGISSRHTGHVRACRSHSRQHCLWKTCLQFVSTTTLQGGTPVENENDTVPLVSWEKGVLTLAH